MEITARPKDEASGTRQTMAIETRIDDATYEALIAQHDHLNTIAAAQHGGQTVYIAGAVSGVSTGAVIADRLLGLFTLFTLPTRTVHLQRRDDLALKLRLIEAARFTFSALAEEDGPDALDMPPMWRRDP